MTRHASSRFVAVLLITSIGIFLLGSVWFRTAFMVFRDHLPFVPFATSQVIVLLIAATIEEGGKYVALRILRIDTLRVAFLFGFCIGLLETAGYFIGKGYFGREALVIVVFLVIRLPTQIMHGGTCMLLAMVDRQARLLPKVLWFSAAVALHFAFNLMLVVYIASR